VANISIKNPRKGADGHRRQHARLLAVYGAITVTSFFFQRGDKTQRILVISTFRELRSHVTASYWGRNSEIRLQKAEVLYYRNYPSVVSATPK